jgi:hypothetical protein
MMRLPSDRGDIGRLQALAALLDVELDALPFFQIPEALSSDLRIVDKNVFAPFPLNESVPLGSIKPLDSSGFSLRHATLLPFENIVRKKERWPLHEKRAQTRKPGRIFLLEPDSYFILHST